MANKSKTGIFYGWTIVIAGCLILLVVFGCQYSYGVFFMELCTDLSWNRALVSGAYSLGFLWQGTISLIAGSLNDKYGPRFTLMISIIAMSVGYALMSTVNAPWQLYVLYGIVIGTGVGFSIVPITSTVPRWFIERRGIALGLTVAGIGIGTLVIAPFSQFLITKFDWRISYLFLAGLLAVIGVPISRLMRLDPSEKGLLPYGTDEIANDSNQHDKYASTVDFSLKQAIETRQFWLLSVMHASYAFVIQMVMIHLKAYAVDFGVAEMTAATAIGLTGGASVVGRIVMGGLSDKIGRKASFFICYLMLAVMMLWLLEARQPWQFYLFSVIFGFGYGGVVPLFPAIIGDWFGEKSYGSILGMLTIPLGIGGAIGPLLAGYIYDIRGSYDIAIITGAVVLFTAMGCSLALKAPPPQKSA